MAAFSLSLVFTFLVLVGSFVLVLGRFDKEENWISVILATSLAISIMPVSIRDMRRKKNWIRVSQSD